MSCSVLLQPVSLEAPCGEDLRYDPFYEDIEIILTNQNSLYASSAVNWASLIPKIEHLLITRTKDITLLCWLCFARFNTEGIIGLNTSLHALLHITKQYWDDCFPRRLKSKIAAIQWLVSQLESQLSVIDQVVYDHEQLSSLLFYLQSLDEQLKNQYSPEQSIFFPMIGQIKKIISTTQSKQTEKPQITDEVAGSASSIKEIPLPTRVIGERGKPTVQASIRKQIEVHRLDIVQTEQDAISLHRQIKKASGNLTAYWMNQDRTDSRSYLLNRAIAWLALNKSPEHNTAFQTKIKPVSITQQDLFKTLDLQKKYDALLCELEKTITNKPLWLTGYYLSWKCLQQLNYVDLATEHAALLQFLILRLPDLVQLKFDDNTPFADKDTKVWIKHTVLTVQKSKKNQMIICTEPNLNKTKIENSYLPPWKLGLTKALEMATTNTVSEAAQYLQQSINHAPNERERCLWRLALVDFCLSTEHTESAFTLLSQLDDTLVQMNIVKWEPNIQLQVLERLKTLYENNPESDAKALNSIKDRLCCLNVCSVFD